MGYEQFNYKLHSVRMYDDGDGKIDIMYHSYVYIIK